MVVPSFNSELERVCGKSVVPAVQQRKAEDIMQQENKEKPTVSSCRTSAEPVAQSIMCKNGKKSDGWHNKALLNIDNSAKKDTKYTLAIRHQPE